MQQGCRDGFADASFIDLDQIREPFQQIPLKHPSVNAADFENGKSLQLMRPPTPAKFFWPLSLVNKSLHLPASRAAGPSRPLASHTDPGH